MNATPVDLTTAKKTTVEVDVCSQSQPVENRRALFNAVRETLPENGALKVELRGELAGILALCDANAKSWTLSDPAFVGRQLKLVAGT